MSHIFLYGPSGAGKSTVGKLLAENLRLPFVDLDQIVEQNAGLSIPTIMSEQGEPRLRDLETAALEQIADDRDGVTALGGGALLRDENRALVEACGTVILLNASASTLYERLQQDQNERPLLAGDMKTKLTSYLEGRAEHYSSFPLKIEVDGKTPEQIAHQAQILLGRHHLSAMGEYDIRVGPVSNLPSNNALIVTDENVARHHWETIKQIMGPDARTVIIPAGEEHKNLDTISHLWKTFLENGLDRKSTVVALGGGVIGDMTGFAAATYMRGIQWIAVPTTLLAMVDASLGGKTGFDLPEGKNLIGAFHPPKMVLADPNLLLTLPDRELCSGMAEVVKHGIISDPELFELCSRGMNWAKANLDMIVKRAIAVKIQVIEDDPYEKGFRAALNLGHTVGHAVELVSRFELRHGEAIAIGMVAETKYAERIGLAQKGLTKIISQLLHNLGLPTQIPDTLPRAELFRAMQVDKKKNAKSIRFALPVYIGKVELVDVSDLESVLE